MVRFQGKQFSLTYPQSTGILLNDLFEHLKRERNIIYVCCAEEKHQDLNIHFHCHLIYSRRKDIKNERYYDFRDHHPNIQVVKRPEDWNDYCKKENNFLEWGKFEAEQDYDLFDSARRDDYENYIRNAIDHKIPPTYATLAWNHCKQVDTTIEPETEIPGTINELLNWYEAPLPFKSTVIVGESGIGKTVFAKRRATKPSLFISHLDDLKGFDPSRHRSIIFDDMSFTHMPVTGQIHLVDLFEPRSIHVRYGTVKLPAGVERWFTCNKFPFEEHPAILRRINKINLY